MRVMLGYCKMCRAEEIKTHGKLVGGNWHKAACKRAGCIHPTEYKFQEKRKISLEKNSV